MSVQRGRLRSLILDNSLLLVAGTIAGLAWANIDHATYERFAHALHFAVNDIGMVFFFALAMKEIIEATLPGGPLASPREAAVPILAAAGGMIVPAGLYVIQDRLARPELMPGWAIPCATDIAFSYLAARLIFPRNHPAIPFLLLLAIADDALGLILLALFYPAARVAPDVRGADGPGIGDRDLAEAASHGELLAVLIFGGGFSWAALYFGGVHPALALVPILPFMPHAKRDLGLFDPREHDLPDTMNRSSTRGRCPCSSSCCSSGW